MVTRSEETKRETLEAMNGWHTIRPRETGSYKPGENDPGPWNLEITNSGG